MASNAVEQEFVVRVPPRTDNKKYHVMKFRASLNQDFSKWSSSRMVRENNQKIVQSNIPENDDPKFGAGSVFGKDMKEELRLKKLGITRKKYDPDAQPWLMRLNGKGGRKYKGRYLIFSRDSDLTTSFVRLWVGGYICLSVIRTP